MNKELHLPELSAKFFILDIRNIDHVYVLSIPSPVRRMPR